MFIALLIGYGGIDVTGLNVFLYINPLISNNANTY